MGALILLALIAFNTGVAGIDGILKTVINAAVIVVVLVLAYVGRLNE